MKDMKKMSLKNIFNWLYAATLDRVIVMSGRRPREDREKISSLYRPISVSYLFRISLVSLFLLLLGGWSTQAWGKKDHNGYAYAWPNTSTSGSSNAGGVYVSLNGNTPSKDSDYKGYDNSGKVPY
ncbi:MAG: hypothetical protein IJP45_09070 [Paludibacteraceae bacterium]|nr:hypothetical protein [Paludibacteraceae bacterium]